MYIPQEFQTETEPNYHVSKYVPFREEMREKSVPHSDRTTPKVWEPPLQSADPEALLRTTTSKVFRNSGEISFTKELLN